MNECGNKSHRVLVAKTVNRLTRQKTKRVISGKVIHIHTQLLLVPKLQSNDIKNPPQSNMKKLIKLTHYAKAELGQQIHYKDWKSMSRNKRKHITSGWESSLSK